MEVLSESEKSRILKKLGVGTELLPRFKYNDPAVIALKAEPGDIIKIERDDGTGKYNAYKAVSAK